MTTSWISKATGNWSSSSTWGKVDSTSINDTEAATSNTTTAFVYSATFTPGAITIDGIALKFSKGQGTPTGTVTLELYNNTDSVVVQDVTVNVSDFPNVGNPIGWHFFKFSSSATLIAGKAYKVGIKTSTNNQLAVFRTATAGDWARMLRTTTTGNPAAGDNIHIIGEHTGAGTQNTFTVTMDSTATTIYGNTTSPSALTIGQNATLSYGTSASTNYYLKYSGTFNVYAGGTFNIGTSGTPIPSTSSAVLEMASATNVDTGLQILHASTFNSYGATKTTLSTFLTADAAASATSLTVGSTSGWASNDQIVIASTSNLGSDSELRTVSTVPTGTTLTVPALTYAHSGTSPTQAEVGNLTRNVKIRGISTSLQGYLYFEINATATLQYTEIYQMGSSTAGSRGININTTTGSFSMQYCSMYNFEVASSYGWYISGTTTNNITISNNISYNIYTSHLYFATTSGTNITVNNNLMIYSPSATYLVQLLTLNFTMNNNTIVGATGTAAVFFNQNNASLGSFSGNTIHSNNSIGLSISPYNVSGTIQNLTVWRSSSYGLQISGVSDLVFDTLVAFGNGTANIYTSSVSANAGTIQINNSTIDAGTDACPIGILFDAPTGMMSMINTTFGKTTTHSTGDFKILNAASSLFLTMNNCLLNSANQLVNQTNLSGSSYIRSSKNNQTVGSHKQYKMAGTISIDTVIYDVLPSERLTPNNASTKLQSSVVKIPVANGGTLSVNVKVRQSVVGDGTAYNGNFARLVVKQNVAAGIANDTVLATATSGANGSFQTLSGTTISVTDDAVLSFYVDCDGTTGWVNLDTWSTS